ncbi:MAG: hypothetical protein EA411_01200 [Saprospirales bacterium]|nr:MAG: hypothetical protein EA411_01200 [Saprospirales bacterium]
MTRIYLILAALVVFCSCGDDDPFDLDSIFFSCNENGEPFNFELYTGLVDDCKSIIVQETFGSSATSWERNEPNRFKRTITQDGLLQESLNNVSWFFFNDITISENLYQYQIDFELEILSGPESRFHVITWGGRDRLDNFFSLGINANRELQIGTVSNSQDFETLFYLPITTSIIAGSNLITIRVVDNMNYFFINETFVTAMQKSLYGNEIGFNVPAMSANKLNNITITRFRTE